MKVIKSDHEGQSERDSDSDGGVVSEGISKV